MKDLVFEKGFYPPPVTPPRVKARMSITEPTLADGNDPVWRFDIDVTLPDGTSRGLGGSVRADDRHIAEALVLYKLVDLLGECLADATKDWVR